MKIYFGLALLIVNSLYASEKKDAIKSIMVEAKISASSKCASQGAMVAFVQFEDKPNEYLYQVEVPVGGTVEFSLIPGKYELEAVNKIGCFGKSSIDLRTPASEKHSLNLEIKE
jgi:hypothetical protein